MTLLAPPRDIIAFTQGKSAFSFFPSGDVRDFSHDGLLLNGFMGSPLSGSVNQIYLRRLDGTEPQAAPLLGLAASPVVESGENCLRQSGFALGVNYEVLFCLVSQTVWLWRVKLRGEGVFDVIFGQDLGVADRGMVLTNELYTSQYLDHAVLEGPHGAVIRSKQNLPQSGGRFPCVFQGMLEGRVKSFCTDAIQFFGLSHKRGDPPEALAHGLPGSVMQYEGAYIGLQSEPVHLNGEASLTFYGQVCPDHQTAKEEELADELAGAFATWQALEPRWQPVPPMRRAPGFGAAYASPAFSRKQIRDLWPDRRLEETHRGALQSFFTGDHTHVVLAGKELRCRRPHGTILMNAQGPESLRPGMLAATNYMYGLFAAQLVIGNTNLHKAVSAARGMLNVQHHGGMRLYVRLEGVYRLLTLPAAYLMTAGSAGWYYLLPGGDRLTVTAFVCADTPDFVLTARSAKGRAYDFLLTCQWVMGEQEWEQEIECTQEGPLMRFALPPERRTLSPYPDWHMDLQVFAPSFDVSDDRVFFADGQPRDGTLMSLSMPQADGFTLQIHGALEEEPLAPLESLADQARETRAFQKNLDAMASSLRIESPDPGAQRLRELVPWYVHNALIHFASPHGLEQPGGAAWGTRDVCQGPFELLRAFGHFPLARQVLLTVFAHQSKESGQWPQWFMFDRYPVAADSCHGDVFLWPLKCAADYLQATGDFDVLAEEIPYAGQEQPEPLLAHIRRAASLFTQRFQEGRALLTYAGGDWDDTLQPADPAMQRHLASSWTQALACQVARGLGCALAEKDPALADELNGTAAQMEQAFSEHMLIHGQIPGFLLRDGDQDAPLLHPEDTRTGLMCRLLPLTRSILAELVDIGQARRNVEQIDRYLNCADGVRLMDRPAQYTGGTARLFRRAEQAANVGREIGLQYVHAHIRYVEAMAKLGLADRAFEGLLTIAPPLLAQSVKNALPRQSNLYFSSSDGDFPDRYAFQQEYHRLRTGDIGVWGGWRLYSSGSGIFLHTLVANIFGLSHEGGGLAVDPVLPKRMDGCSLTYACLGRTWHLTYHVKGGPGRVKLRCGGREVSGVARSNRYRPAGLLIPRDTLLALAGDALDIYLE